MKDSEPNPNYSFPDYKRKVVELIEQTDKVFGLDAGRVGMILLNPKTYFNTIKKLKNHICAKVSDKNLSIPDSLMLKDLRTCLEFRVELLFYRVPLIMNNPKVVDAYHRFLRESS